MKNLFLIIILIINYSCIISEKCLDGWDAYDSQLKCIKIITDTVDTYDNAIHKCTTLAPGSTLLTIHSPEEQDYMIDYLYTKHKLFDSIWLGAQVNQKLISWMDHSTVMYTNWAQGRPLVTTVDECLEIRPDSLLTNDADGGQGGKWYDTQCTKHNQVVCQQMQQVPLGQLEMLLMEISMHAKILETKLQNQQVELGKHQVELGKYQDQLSRQQDTLINQQDELDEHHDQLVSQQDQLGKQKIIMDNQQLELGKHQVELGKHQDTLDKQQDTLEKHQDQLGKQQDQLGKQQVTLDNQQVVLGKHQDQLVGHNDRLDKLEKSNPIPVGFIYVQLSGQSEPSRLWSQYKWLEITGNYSGLFFRAEGSGSEPFGQIQVANQSSIVSTVFSQQRILSGGTNFKQTLIELNYTQGGWTPDFLPGTDQVYLEGLKFFMTLGENRPRNQAIRIFKRIE